MDPEPEPNDPLSAVDTSIELVNTVIPIVKEVGEMLNSIPYVKSLSGVILQIIQIRDEIKANKQRCREIIDKVLRMSKSIYEKLAEVAKSTQRNKLSRLEDHLKQHERTLTALLNVLEKHRSRSRFSKFINRGLDELNQHDRRLDELNTQLILDIIFHVTMEQAASAPAIANVLGPSVGTAHVLPPRPQLMVQREMHFNSALKILLSTESSRIAILGGGGFGKTTLARSVLHDPKIIERYNSRYFLSCEGITDFNALLLGFGAMLGIKASASEIIASARHVLSTSVTILCLDNVETPWEPSATRSKIEDVLASIADIPNLSLIITLRGTQRPSKVAWSYPFLPPLPTLSSTSACLILQTICPNHIIDEFTQNLLNSIEGIPLAITLIANLLRDGESSRALWTRWSREQTNVIANGGDDRESSLDASITLSLRSPRTTKDPDAITLLAALSLLPDGFPLAEIERLEEYLGITSVHKHLQTLRAVALVKPDEAEPSPRIQMLSPIRLYCLKFLVSEISVVLEKITDYYISVMLDTATEWDISVFYNQVAPEIQNIHSVFYRVYKTDYARDISELTDATISLVGWSRYIGYISYDTIQIALERSIGFPILHAKCLMSLADLSYMEGLYTRAEELSREATEIFRQGHDTEGEAYSLFLLGLVLSSMRESDQAEGAFKASLELYDRVDSKAGQANVRLYLGNLYIEKAQYSEAEATCTSAMMMYKQIRGTIGQANTANALAWLHISLGDLVKAEEFATESLATAEEANYATGVQNALLWLGRIYLGADNITDARQVLEQALALAKLQNDTINYLIIINDLAQLYIQSDQLFAADALLTSSAKVELDVVQIPDILTTLGWLYIHGNQVDKAEPLLDRALDLFRYFKDTTCQADVLLTLGIIYLQSNRLGDAERVLHSIPGSTNRASIEIRRLWILGDLYTLQGKFQDAKTSFDAAIVRCQGDGNRPNSYLRGNIFRSMGTLHIKCGRVDRAIRAFKRARDFHRKAQWVSEQATDLKRLGEAFELLERSEDAKVSFKEAEELMETVREARTLKL